MLAANLVRVVMACYCEWRVVMNIFIVTKGTWSLYMYNENQNNTEYDKTKDNCLAKINQTFHY